MKVIEIEKVRTLPTSIPALFFIEQMIVIDDMTKKILLPAVETIARLELQIKTIFLDNQIMIMNGQSPLSADMLLKRGLNMISVRQLLTLYGDEGICHQVLRAVHWLTWDDKSIYCSKCGNKLEKITDSMEKKCARCDLSFFPKLSPAVMVLIYRKNEILLGRSPHFRPGVYSVIAGFIDIAESAEQAVHREVKEEVNIAVSHLQYFGSQGWPFPDSFMIAFTARYLSGELKIDEKEIEDARWFKVNHLPELPPLPSIARKLIEGYLNIWK